MSTKPSAVDAGSRLKKALPTDRMSVSSQLKVLRGYAAASSNGQNVFNAEVAKAAGIAQTSVSTCNPFFVELGLIVKDKTGWVPCDEVRQFGNAARFDPETAAYRLAPVFERSWCFEALRPRLSMGSMSHQEALIELSAACGADPERQDQLEEILEFFDFVGLIEFADNGDSIVLRQQAHRRQPEPREPAVVAAPPMHAPSRPPATNGVNFSVDISIDTTQIATWSADRITAFFAGLAQVIAAKGESEGRR